MHIDTDQQLNEISVPQRRLVPGSLGDYKQHYRTRNLAIIEAYQSGGHTLKQIGDYFLAALFHGERDYHAS